MECTGVCCEFEIMMRKMTGIKNGSKRGKNENKITYEIKIRNERIERKIEQKREKSGQLIISILL